MSAPGRLGRVAAMAPHVHLPAAPSAPRTRRRIGRVAAAALALGLAVPAAASAAEGAYVAKSNVCQENAFGTVCVDQHAVFGITEAGASGNLSVVSNMRYANTWTGKGPLAGCVSGSTGRITNHQLLTDDGTHQLRFRLTNGSQIDCNGWTVDCETVTSYSFANGEVRVNGVRSICKDPV